MTLILLAKYIEQGKIHIFVPQASPCSDGRRYCQPGNSCMQRQCPCTPPCSIIWSRTIFRLNRAATDNKRMLCRIAVVVRNGLGCIQHPHWQQSNSISVSKAGNEIALAHAVSQASTGSKVSVACNCKKGCATWRSRRHNNELKCSICCRNAYYGCSKKPLTEIPLRP